MTVAHHPLRSTKRTLAHPPSHSTTTRKAHPPLRNAPSPKITVRALENWREGWYLECEYRQHSERTIETRKGTLARFFWWLTEHEKTSYVDAETIKRFLVYVSNAHKGGGVRWGEACQHYKATKEVTPGTIASYHRRLRAFFNWIAKQDDTASLMEKIEPPVDRPDQVEPFTSAELEALERAVEQTRFPLRNTLILYLLEDTGMRASELLALRTCDIETNPRRIHIQDGKGGKSRTVPYGSSAARAYWNYTRKHPVAKDAPLFCSETGTGHGRALTRNGLYQLVRDWARESGIKRAHCGPHTFRHTFAVEFLRNGGNQMSLMEILGHTSLLMTSRYVKLAQADLDKQHAGASPLEARKRKK